MTTIILQRRKVCCAVCPSIAWCDPCAARLPGALLKRSQQDDHVTMNWWVEAASLIYYMMVIMLSGKILMKRFWTHAMMTVI